MPNKFTFFRIYIFSFHFSLQIKGDIIFLLSDAVGVDIMITIKIDSLCLSSPNKKDLVIEFLHFIIATDVLYKMA